jgi:hypothetical protein
MDGNPTSADFCAHCHLPLEIITVRFRFAGAEVISACPNCAMTGAKSPAANLRVGKDSTFPPGHATASTQQPASVQQPSL